MEISLSEAERENETLAHRFHIDIFRNRKLEVADEILSSNFVLHNPILPQEFKSGPEGVKRFASAAMTAIPDMEFSHEDTLAIGDEVLIRWTLTGTNTGNMFGNPPTGKPAVITGFDLFRITGGKIVEMWQQYNFGNWS
jgi:predicted ester cyclase